MPVAEKPWWQSKTVVVNALGLIAFALALVGQNAGALQLDTRWVIGAGMGVLFVNEALRLVTNSAISGTPAAKATVTPTPTQRPNPAPVDVGASVMAITAQRDALNAKLEEIGRIAGVPAPQPALPASTPTPPQLA